MQAIVTRRVGVMELADVPEPDQPGPGQVVVRPEAVGLCGSDYHFLTGDLVTPPQFGPQYPRVQGHEVCGTIEAVGADCPPQLRVGQRVAVAPLTSCGTCYACGIGRENACPNFRLIGVHVDGALQERFTVSADQVFDVGDTEPATAAFCEPMSVAVRALARGQVTADESVLVLGAGPIGQAVTIAAGDRGARVLLVDLVAGRLELGRAAGADGLDLSTTAPDEVAARVRGWSGGQGPPVVLDCTGAPAAIRMAVDLVSPAGRVVVVGISHKEVGLPVNAFTDREIDVRGSTICTTAEFAEAVAIVGRHPETVARLITHRRPLPEASAAVEHAMRNPGEVMKLVISSSG